MEDRDGAIDISGNTGIKFYLRNVETGDKKIDGKDASEVNASEGRVKYEWDPEDVDTPGVYEAEFVVSFTDGEQTFPSNNFKSVRIEPDIEEN